MVNRIAGMLWLWTLFGVSLLVLAWLKKNNRRDLRMCRGIPSAQPYYPILGNVLTFASSLDVVIEDVLGILEESVLKGQRALCFWLCGYPLVFITNHEDIKTVLNNTVSRGKEFEESGKEFMKYGLLLAPVGHWKVTRRQLNLAFQPRNLEQLMPTFNANSRQLALNLSAHIDCSDFNIMPNVMTTALNTVGTFLYGPKTMDIVSEEQFKYIMDSLTLAGDLMALRLAKPWLRNDTLLKFMHGKDIDTVKNACQLILNIGNMFSNRKIRKDESNGDSNVQGGNGGCEFTPILDILMNLQTNCPWIKDDHILDEMITVIAAGSETIAISVSSCFIALASFPIIQNKLYEEICSVVPEEEDVTFDHLNQLTYLEQVIKETLRYFTVVPFTPRCPTRDIQLDGYTIPANRLTILCLSSVCFDPNIFSDPHKFDPDRFSAASSVKDSAFMPFSRGPRNCIGKTYAMMLMKVMIVHVVRKYNMTTLADMRNPKRAYKITLDFCNGYNLSLSHRSK